MTRLAFLLVPFAIAYGACAACGGQASSVSAGVSDGGGDASTDGPVTAHGPLTGTLIAACPSSPAPIGGACTPVGQLCEYGDDANSTCNVVRHCSPSARWESASDGSGKTCSSTLRACVGDPSGTCAPLSETCTTSHGVCTCVDTSGPPRQDAGPASSAWTCSSPNPVCPAWPARPRIGSACSMPEVQCDYAACGPTGFAFRCDPAGYWTDSFSSPCGGG